MRRGDKHSKEGNFGFMHEFMVNLNQCLESFENRHWASEASVPDQYQLRTSLNTHTRDVLEMSQNIPLDHFEIRKTNTKQYNHEIDHQDCESNWEQS